MNKNRIANRQVICDVLMQRAEQDPSLVVLCSDSRGSASLTPFAEKYPSRFVEAGIAEQDLVGIAAGLASCGKRPFAAAPASFLSTRSYEQIKIDVAYSHTNVKLIGISGGVSYGALGMSHHSLQDIAAISAIPGMRVYLPSDQFLTRRLMEQLSADGEPAYIRIGRNPVDDVYADDTFPFVMDRAIKLADGKDVLIAACGEMVALALAAAGLLAQSGISASVLDMYCLKPFDTQTLLQEAAACRLVVTVEEHAPFGGLGAMTAQTLSAQLPKRVLQLSLPDAPVYTGTSQDVFRHYGLDAQGIADTIRKQL